MYPPPSNAVHFVNIIPDKPTSDRLQQMKTHKTFQQTGDGRLNNDWRDEVMLDDKYEDLGSVLLKFGEQFADFWNGNLGCFTIAEPYIELTSNSVRTAHSAPYRLDEREDMLQRRKSTECSKKMSSNR